MIVTVFLLFGALLHGGTDPKLVALERAVQKLSGKPAELWDSPSCM